MNYLGGTVSENLSNVRSNIDPESSDLYDIGSNKRFRSGNFVNLLCNTINPKTYGDLDIGRVNADVIRLGGDGVFIDNGYISATGFIKAGGTNAQYLMADGSVTTSSNANQGSNIYLYLNSILTSGIPAVSYLRFNNTVQRFSTQVVVSYQARYGLDIDAFLSMIDQNSILYIQDYSNSQNYIKFSVDSVVCTTNSNTLCNVTFIVAEGTGLTSFGNNTALYMSVFLDNESIDNRITTLETNCTELNDKTINISSVPGTTSFVYKIICPQFDALSEPLTLGLTDATQIEIGRPGIVTSVNGSCNIVTRLNTPLLDRATVGSLAIGTSSNISDIAIGGGNIITSITGASTNISARLNANLIDRATVGQMFIGNITASGITLGGGSIITSVAGNGLNVTIRITCPVFDTVSSGNMTIGTTNQTGLTIGRPQTTTSIRGSPLTSDSAIVNFTTCIPTISANSKLICSRYVMSATSVVTNTGPQNLSPGFGNLSWSLGDNFTTLIVGTTLRITGIGYLTSMAAGSTIGVILNYGPTSNYPQQLFNVLFANATSAGVFSFEVNIQILSTGTITNPLINGSVTYTDGTATVTKPILVTLWSYPVNTQTVNTLTFVTIVTGSVSYGINSFMVDNIR